MRISSITRKKYSLAFAWVTAALVATAVGCNEKSGPAAGQNATPKPAPVAAIPGDNATTIQVAMQEDPTKSLMNEIEANFTLWQEGKPFDFKPAAAKVVKLLEAGLDQQNAELASGFGRGAETAGSYEVAKQLYTALLKAAGKSDNPRLSPQAKDSANAGLSRLALLGTTPKLDSTVFGGGKFDWDKYKGKVVLIDFWATWCGPCLAELPNVRKVHEQLHNQGFEVVGISLDEEKETLAKFLEKEKLPWPTLWDESPEKQGWKSPLAKAFGIDGIPATYLIDKSGKIASISARGPDLETQVKKLLAEKPAEKK